VIDVLSAPIGEIRAASAANGTALTTTAAFVNLPYPTKYLLITPRNFVTAVVCRYAINPYLVIGKTTDALVAVANFTDASKNLQNNPVGTALSLNSLNTAANSNFLYVGAHLPFRGARVLVGNVNATASVLTVKYWNGTAWTDITATDGTASGGATMAQNGNVTWTVPTAWQTGALSSAGLAALAGIGDTTLGAIAAAGTNIATNPKLFWTRWQVSIQLGASVSITQMYAMNRVTVYSEMLSGATREFRIQQDFGGIGSVEALTDAGTANLLVEAAAMGTGNNFS